MVLPIKLPNFTEQTASEYKTAIDESIEGISHVLNSFAPRQSDPTGMEIIIDAAYTAEDGLRGPWVLDGIGVPSDKDRIDIVYYNPNSNDVNRITGTEDDEPSPPSIPYGVIPIALINLHPSMTAILNQHITDIRPAFSANYVFADGGYGYIVDPDGLYRVIIGRAGSDNRIIFSMHPNGSIQFRDENSNTQVEINDQGDINAQGQITAEGNLVLHEGNTTEGPNGEILAASPVIKLFDSKIETNTKARFNKLSTGVYELTNTNGLRLNGGRYLDTPEDRNGNKYFNVDWEQDYEPNAKNGILNKVEKVTLTIRTYKREWNSEKGIYENGVPIDINDSRFISLRMNEVKLKKK